MAENRKAIIHCCIEREVHDLLMEHCRQTGQTKTTAIKRAIRAYCADNGVAVGTAAGKDGDDAVE